jgi:hypothetical protein
MNADIDTAKLVGLLQNSMNAVFDPGNLAGVGLGLGLQKMEDEDGKMRVSVARIHNQNTLYTPPPPPPFSLSLALDPSLSPRSLSLPPLFPLSALLSPLSVSVSHTYAQTQLLKYTGSG